MLEHQWKVSDTSGCLYDSGVRYQWGAGSVTRALFVTLTRVSDGLQDVNLVTLLQTPQACYYSECV